MRLRGFHRHLLASPSGSFLRGWLVGVAATLAVLAVVLAAVDAASGGITFFNTRQWTTTVLSSVVFLLLTYLIVDRVLDRRLAERWRLATHVPLKLLLDRTNVVARLLADLYVMEGLGLEPPPPWAGHATRRSLEVALDLGSRRLQDIRVVLVAHPDSVPLLELADRLAEEVRAVHEGVARVGQDDDAWQAFVARMRWDDVLAQYYQCWGALHRATAEYLGQPLADGSMDPERPWNRVADDVAKRRRAAGRPSQLELPDHRAVRRSLGLPE